MTPALKTTILLSPLRNYLVNTTFAGAATGTPGTQPTGWVSGTAFGSMTAASLTIGMSVAGATRQSIFSNSVSIAPGSTWTAAVDVLAVSGAGADTIFSVTATAGSLTTSPVVTVAAGTGRQVLTFTAGAAGATVLIRLGVGVNSNTAGAASVTFSRPQLGPGSIDRPYQQRP